MTSSIDTFRAGGTLPLHATTYVVRPADKKLFNAIVAGRFCYVLTSRQRGKSSLIIRTADQLRQIGYGVAIIDLSAIGTQLSEEQWYLGILRRIADDLQLDLLTEAWWYAQGNVSPVQRFTDFIRLLANSSDKRRIVICIDEIDSTLKLDFTDDFFVQIRSLYNLRATEPELDHITFVLLGAATPTDLIKNLNRTPFNIGQAIDLSDFSLTDTRPLQDALEQLFPGQGAQLLNRIYYWTNGHPYLTQRLCVALAEARERSWNEQSVDALVRRLFFEEAEGKDSNIQFVRESMRASAERVSLLTMYRQIHRHEDVEVDERAPIQNRLRLFGLVRIESGRLVISNNLYRELFDERWIQQNTPVNTTRNISIIAIATAVLSIVIGIAVYQQQQAEQRRQLIANLTKDILAVDHASTQLDFLDQLCRVDATAARTVFFERISEQQRLRLFTAYYPPDADQRLYSVGICLKPGLVDHPSTVLAEHIDANIQRERSKDGR